MGLQRVRHDWACTQHTYSIAKGVIVTQKWDRVGKPWCLWIQLHSTLTYENFMQILACGKAFEFIFLCSMSFHNFSCLNMYFKWTVCGLWTWSYLGWHHLKPEVPVSLKYWFAMFDGTCHAGDLGLISGSGRSLGEVNDNSLQYSCLENPVDRGAWRATVHGVAKSQTWLSD